MAIVNPESPYPYPCFNHFLAFDIRNEEKERFCHEQSNNWITALNHHFGLNPEILTDISHRRSIGDNLDILTHHIFPKLNAIEQKKAILVCKGWGRAILSKHLFPNFQQRFHWKTKHVYEVFYHAKYLILEGTEERKCMMFRCSCQVWRLFVEKNVYPRWMVFFGGGV